jgi:ATP-dependent RNA helicase DeaD
MSDPIMEMEFNLKPEIQQAIEAMGFLEFTEIQKMALPLLLEGRDVIGHSHTGTGKTAAYAIPILEKIDQNSDAVQALIICPTRELSLQIRDEILRIAKFLPKIKVVTVYGGDPISNQLYAMRKKPQIIVGTPGRTIDHLDRGTLKLDQLAFMVMDEADEMLKMGFQEDIEKIFDHVPEFRQTMMFSATMPRTVMALAKSYMNDPEVIKIIGDEETNTDVIQHYYKVRRENKTEAIYRLLNVYHPKLALIFCNTKAKVDELTQELIDRGINCDKIHGDLPQTTRLDVLKKFHNGVINVMIATDVAARGLDIHDVEAVFNYDVPEKADYYVHRIGRTGRIGNTGYSFTLVSKGEMKEIEEIERITKTTIKKRNIPTYDKVLDVANEKLINRISDLVKTQTFDAEYEILNKMVSEELTEDKIIVALLKMLRKESSVEINQEDINEEFEIRRPYENKGGFGEGLARFHLNLGKQDDLSVSDILDFVCSKIKIQRREVTAIAILTEFSFFSVPARVADEVMSTLNGTKLKGKRAGLSASKPPRTDRFDKPRFQK